MSPTLESLIRDKGDFYATSLPIEWQFYVEGNGEPELIELSGLFDITTEYSTEPRMIENARTLVKSYLFPYNTIKFSNPETGDRFLLELNRVTEVDIQDGLLFIEFAMHQSKTNYAFNIQKSILGGTAHLNGEESQIDSLHSLIRANLYVNDDHVIPRCEHCAGLMSVPEGYEMDIPLDDVYYICVDCYLTANKFFIMLVEEIAKSDSSDNLSENKEILMQLAYGGKDFAEIINDEQLLYFYDVLIIQVQFFSDEIDAETALKSLNEYYTYSAENEFEDMQAYVQALIAFISSQAEGLEPVGDKAKSEERMEHPTKISSETSESAESSNKAMDRLKAINLRIKDKSKGIPSGPFESPMDDSVKEQLKQVAKDLSPKEMGSPPPAPKASPPPAPKASPPPAPTSSTEDEQAADTGSMDESSNTETEHVSEIENAESDEDENVESEVTPKPRRRSFDFEKAYDDYNVDDDGDEDEEGFVDSEPDTVDVTKASESEADEKKDFGFLKTSQEKKDAPVKLKPFTAESHSGAKLQNLSRKKKKKRTQICPICGRVVQKGKSVCPNCGAPVQ